MDLRRRQTLGLLLATASAVAGAQAAQGQRTPPASEGPFYPPDSMRLADRDNDLVKVAELVQEAGGEVLHLAGSILNRTGQPMPGLRVEIWQCDARGRYLHAGDRGGARRDPGFQGFGFDTSDDSGRYYFRTIKPVAYPGRTPHIHVKVLHDDQELLTTQFYLANHPSNHRDALFRRMTTRQAEAASMHLTPETSGFTTELNIVV